MRIFKALYLIPQRIDLLGAVFCYFLDRRRYIDLPAVFKDLDLQLFGNKIGHDLALPGVVGVEYLVWLALIYFFGVERYNIGYCLAGLAVVEPPRNFNTGKCNFRRVFAYLYLRDNLAFFFNRRKLIYAAEDRLARSGYKALTDAVAVNLRALEYHIAY